MNAQQILSGLGWSAMATLVSAACQFVFMAVLARLLDPAAFGLMAMAGIALRFAGFFAQMGFAQAIIQRQKITAEDTTAALLMALGVGALLYAAMVLAAPLFGEGFRAPELPLLITVLGLSLLLGSLGSLPIALLRRQARFKRVNAIEVFSFIVGYGAVGIVCASRGLGVWSLVAATLSQQALVIAAGFLAVRYPLAWPVPRAAFMQLWGYGSRYSLIGFLEFLSANVETLF
ncbi:MAG: oligosaccharide flippase family protein, partial [Bacteriovorax sp.]|nr:oligosaccharide flippase family protein [Rhizobacter sp.]